MVTPLFIVLLSSLVAVEETLNILCTAIYFGFESYRIAEYGRVEVPNNTPLPLE